MYVIIETIDREDYGYGIEVKVNSAFYRLLNAQKWLEKFSKNNLTAMMHPDGMGLTYTTRVTVRDMIPGAQTEVIQETHTVKIEKTRVEDEGYV